MLVNSKVHKVLFLLLSFSFIFTACEKKDENSDGWQYCTECTVESWVGEYTGMGDYNNFNKNAKTQAVDVSIAIEQTATDYITVYFQAPSYYTTTVSGDLASPDIISFAGSSSSLSATMYIKDGEFKLTGNTKKFHYKQDTLVVDQVVTFETIKKQ